MARTAFVALACGMLGAASALKVVSPESGTTVVSGRWAVVQVVPCNHAYACFLL